MQRCWRRGSLHTIPTLFLPPRMGLASIHVILNMDARTKPQDKKLRIQACACHLYSAHDSIWISFARSTTRRKNQADAKDSVFSGLQVGWNIIYSSYVVFLSHVLGGNCRIVQNIFKRRASKMRSIGSRVACYNIRHGYLWFEMHVC